MCLAIPSRIISIEDKKAVVDVYGARRDVSHLLLPEEVNVGDYLLVHAGFAIHKIDEDAAEESYRLLKMILEEETA